MASGINPPEPVKGFGKLGKFVNDLLSYAKSNRLIGIEIEQEASGVPPKATIVTAPNGTRVTLRVPPGGTSGGGSTAIPFQLVDLGGSQIQIRYGQVVDFINNTNWVPSGMSEGDDPPYVLSVTGSGTVYLLTTNTVDTDTGLGAITSISITLTGGSSDATHAYLILGTFSVQGDGSVLVVGAAGDLGWFYSGAQFFWSL